VRAGLACTRTPASGPRRFARLLVVADLPRGTDETELRRRLGHAGLAVDVLSQYTTITLAR